MNSLHARICELAAGVILVACGAGVSSAQNEELSLTVGLSTTCPYGPAFG
jgi:hypothetical protein